MITPLIVAYIGALAAIIVSIVLAKIKGRRGEFASFVLIGLLIADFLLTLTPAWFESQGSFWFIPLAVYNTMGMLLFEGMASSMYTPLLNSAGTFQIGEEFFFHIYIFTLFICYVATPVMLATSAYSLLTRRASESRIHRQVRSFLKRKGDPLYVFSSLNKRSVAFARSLFSDGSGYSPENVHKTDFNKHVLCVFANVNQTVRDENSQIINELRSKGICFYEQDVKDLFEQVNGWGGYIENAHAVHVFFLKEDEGVEKLNLGNAIEFIEYLASVVPYTNDEDCKRYYRGFPCYHIYCACHGESDELALDAIEDRTGFDIKVVDESREIIYQLLWNHPLYESTNLPSGMFGLDTSQGGGQLAPKTTCENLDVVVIGFGRYGFEAVRACLWMGQIPNTKLRVHVVDKISWELFISSFEHKCPGFFQENRFDSDEGSGVMIDNGQKSLRVSRFFELFFYSCDVTTQAFDDAVSLIRHRMLGPNPIVNEKNNQVEFHPYCILCLGNDDLNMDVAVRVRRLFIGDIQQPIIRPTIFVDIYDLRRHGVVERMSAKGAGGNPVGFELIPFGGMENVFNRDYLIESKIDSLALNVNASYSNYFNQEEKVTLRDLKENFDGFSSWQMNRLSSITAALSIKTKLWLLGFELADDVSASGSALTELEKLLSSYAVKYEIVAEGGENTYDDDSSLGMLASVRAGFFSPL